MKNLWTLLVVATTFPIFATPSAASEHECPVDRQASYEHARELLNRSLSAHGGSERIRDIGSIEFQFNGHVAALLQGQSPENPHRMIERSGQIAIDLKGVNLKSEHQTRWPNFTQSSHTLVTSDKTFTIDDNSQTYRESDDASIESIWNTRLVPLLLKHVYSEIGSLGCVGVLSDDGEKFNVLHSVGPDGRILYIYLSANDHLVRRLQYMDYSPDLGDRVTEYRWAGYQTVKGIPIPVEFERFDNGRLVTRYEIEGVNIEGEIDPDEFSVPANYQPAEQEAPSDKGENAIRVIDPGVYLIERIAGQDYNVMFVEQNDHVVVFEAPLGNRASRIVMDQIKATIPNKPVRYVFLTHFHGDHSGGVRAYVLEGARIITTPDSASHFKDLLNRPHTLDQSIDQKSPTSPKLLLVEGKVHQMLDGKIPVHFYNIGDTPHVDNLLVAYLPEQKMLFQGDIFRVPEEGTEPDPGRPGSAQLYKFINSEGLAVDVIAGAHGPVGDIEDLRTAVNLGQALE